MTNHTPESVIAEVIEYHADAIDTHGPGCYKNHAACLAVKLRDMLREPGVPDAATETCGARAVGGWCVLPRAHNMGQLDIPENHRSAEAERDAATEGRMSLAELEDIAETHAFCADRLFIETELVDEIRADRDAALAAVGRVRAALGEVLPDWSDNGVVAVADILAALDGAPEPEAVEWEYAVGGMNPGSTEAWAHDEDDISSNFDTARAWTDEAIASGSFSNAIVVKRRVNPWLPVEGESKP